ncbi:MAG: TRAP transporter small permease subunit [Deltaproteobacteria bacterium]|nr:TRAP transporter small permease subunit [Deltaproteobacteria bacterium]MBW2016534.1 TRAP transporter small permease subunit [Deltaproteobacteria bacterium]MBW2128714.1 TRAP transporter small permease subunit [Deltaproteobacteria bacterium]MBW2302404.1 TRAP transporter small permease subunit [Deltaproteobacteria bacterium]
MGFLSTTDRIFDVLLKVLAWLAGILMMFALASVSVDVVLRYFFNKPIGWVLQISEYILLYIPFLAAGYVLRQESHIRIDIVLNRVNRRLQNKINMITSLLGALVLLILAYYGAYVTYDFYQRGVPTLKYLKIPEFLVIMVIPVGCFFFAAEFVRRACKLYKEGRTGTLSGKNSN